MRCDICKLQDYIDGELVIPTAQERATIRMRRLADIRYVRKVTWRDDP